MSPVSALEFKIKHGWLPRAYYAQAYAYLADKYAKQGRDVLSITATGHAMRNGYTFQ